MSAYPGDEDGTWGDLGYAAMFILSFVLLVSLTGFAFAKFGLFLIEWVLR